MELLHSNSIFIVVGSLIGFSEILMSIFSCLFLSSPDDEVSGSCALKFVMLAFLLCYLYNSIYFAFYTTQILLSCLPEGNRFFVYVHNGIKLILSILITVMAAKLWESCRTVAHCIRFSDCDDSHMTLVHVLNAFTDFFCGPSRGPDYDKDGCRRWFAQMPLIFLTIASILVIHWAGQVWAKFDNPDDDPPTSKQRSSSSNGGGGGGGSRRKDVYDGKSDIFCSKCQKCEVCCTCSCTFDRKPAKKPKSHHHDRDDCRNSNNYHEKGVSLEKVLRDCIHCD